MIIKERNNFQNKCYRFLGKVLSLVQLLITCTMISAAKRDPRVWSRSKVRINEPRTTDRSALVSAKQYRSGIVITLHNNDTRKQRESSTASCMRAVRGERPLNILSTRSDYLHFTRQVAMITTMAI